MADPLRDVPQEGIELIKSFEGIPDGDPSTVNIDAYLDPVGIWTIGWGHAITYQGGFLRGAANEATARALYPGGITRAQAEALLRGDLVDTAAAVLHMAQADLDDDQYGALVSFAFNAGTTNLRNSTLLRLLNGGDVAGAADQFLVWNKGRVNGVLQPLAGLTRRRQAERALFLGQDWRAAAGVPAVSRERGAAPADAGGIAPTLPPAFKREKTTVARPATPVTSKVKAKVKVSAAAGPQASRAPTKVAPAKKAGPKARATSRGRTTTPTAPPPPSPAKPRVPRKRR